MRIGGKSCDSSAPVSRSQDADRLDRTANPSGWKVRSAAKGDAAASPGNVSDFSADGIEVPIKPVTITTRLTEKRFHLSQLSLNLCLSALAHTPIGAVSFPDDV
jgi:hypothetical protein